jgi:hypothetical protein
MIRELNDRIASDADFRQALREATVELLRVRDSLGELGSRLHPGGGPDRIKCLHAHTAQQLVTGGNLAGQAVLAALGWSDPDAACV